MKVAIVGNRTGIEKGELLRLEKDTVFGKVNVVKPGFGAIGVLSPLSYEGSVPARVIYEEYDDNTYVIAAAKENIFLIADIIIPVDFTYAAVKMERERFV